MKAFVALLLLSLVFSSASAAPPKSAPVHRDLAFATRDGKPLYLDLYLPENSASRPVPLVIWLHGGAWAFGRKGVHFWARRLTEEGFAVATVGYRLSLVAKYPAQLDDCRDALQWLRAHARAYGIDRDRIYLSGASAGGHLAALLALEQGRGRIRGVLLMYPPTDLTAYAGHKLRFGYIPLLLGGPVAHKRALAQAASPVNHVRRNAPPFYILHGAYDIIVPVSHSETLHRRLRAAGVESHLVIGPRRGHNFRLTPAEVKDVAAFFRKQG